MANDRKVILEEYMHSLLNSISRGSECASGLGSNKLGRQTDEKWIVIPINPSQPRLRPALPLETSFARANRFSFVLM